MTWCIVSHLKTYAASHIFSSHSHIHIFRLDSFTTKFNKIWYLYIYNGIVLSSLLSSISIWRKINSRFYSKKRKPLAANYVSSLSFWLKSFNSQFYIFFSSPTHSLNIMMNHKFKLRVISWRILKMLRNSRVS